MKGRFVVLFIYCGVMQGGDDRQGSGVNDNESACVTHLSQTLWRNELRRSDDSKGQEKTRPGDLCCCFLFYIFMIFNVACLGHLLHFKLRVGIPFKRTETKHFHNKVELQITHIHSENWVRGTFDFVFIFSSRK